MGECTLFRAEVALSANSIAVLDFNIAALDSGTRSVSGHDQGQSGLELEEVRDGTDHCHLGLNLWLGKKKKKKKRQQICPLRGMRTVYGVLLDVQSRHKMWLAVN